MAATREPNDSVAQDDGEAEQTDDGGPDAQLERLLAVVAQLESASAEDDPAAARSMRIQAARTVLQDVPEGGRRTEMLEMLAATLYDQSQAIGSLEILDESLEFLSQALEATDIKQEYARLATVYSGYLAQRYVRSRTPADIDNALEFAEGSINLIKELHNEQEKRSLLLQAVPNRWLCTLLRLQFADLGDDEANAAFELLMKLALEADRLASDGVVEESTAIALAKTNLGKTLEMKWSGPAGAGSPITTSGEASSSREKRSR